MIHNYAEFDQRVRKLDRKHRAMAQGFVTRLRKDGLIVVTPKRTKFRFPLKQLCVLFAAVILYKAFLLANLGPETYGERVTRMAEGTVVEQIGAAFMQIDPASEYLASQIGPVLR